LSPRFLDKTLTDFFVAGLLFVSGRTMALPATLARTLLLAGRDGQPANQRHRQYGSHQESHNTSVRIHRLKSHLISAVILFLAACGGNRHPLLEDLNHREDFSAFRLGAARGVRDGDRLSAQVLLTDSSGILTLDLIFEVTPPTHLESGSWKYSRGGGTGSVAAPSVTFLGGQSGPPSLGGTFDLLGPDGRATYRVHLPLTPLPIK
jgi:hypothetical protein